MKKILSVLCAIFVLISAFPAYAQQSGVNLLFNGSELVLDTPAKIIDNRTMVPIRGVFEKIGAEVLWNDEIKEVTIKNGGQQLSLIIGENSAVVNDEKVLLDVPAVIEDGRTLVPLRFVAETLGGDVSWDEKTKTVSILYNLEKESVANEGDAPKPLKIVSVTAIGSDGNIPENTLDGDYNTRWSHDGTDSWIIFELEKKTTIGYIGFAWYYGDVRIESFDLYVSEDGENYTHINSAESYSGLGMYGYDLKNTVGKYVKVVCHGNNENTWNSMTECKIYPPSADGKLTVENAKLDSTMTGVEITPEIQAALDRLNQFIGKDIVQWAINLYDPETGGFYATTSSRDYEPFTPFAESTYFVTDILRGGGMLSTASTPQWWKDKVAAWILSHQSEADGYFYEDMFGPYTDGARKNRDLQYSVALLKRVGYQPLYKTPQERIAEENAKKAAEEAAKNPNAAVPVAPAAPAAPKSVPTHLQSRENFIAWLDKFDWSSKGIWNTGNELSSAKSVIESAGLVDVARDYIISKQNPETGVWGDAELSYSNTNGTMKLSSYFDKEHPFPNLINMIESCIKIQQGDAPADSATYIWNIVEAMGRALSTYDPVPEDIKKYILDNAALIINTSVDSAVKLKAPDGGFTSAYGGAGCVGAGGRFGYGLLEGDVDGTRIISTLLRDSFAKILGINLGRTYFKEYEQWFWEELEKKEPIKKKTLPKVDFETDETFADLHGTTGRGNYSVVEDPNNPEGNKCLKFDKTVSNDISINLPVPGGSNYKKMTFSMDIMVESMTAPNFFGFRLGIESYDAVINMGSAGDWTLSNNSEILTDNLNKGEWYQLKIEYMPDGLDNSVLKFYIDGTLVKTTNKLYLGANGTNTTVPHIISNLRIYSWAASPGLGVFYVDNIDAQYN